MVRMVTVFYEQNLAESRSKVRIEDGVYDRVKQTVEVTEPANDADQQRREVASFGAERSQQGNDEERKPADDERTGDNGQSSGSFTLSGLCSLQSLGLGRRRFGAAEFRKLQARQIESTASM